MKKISIFLSLLLLITCSKDSTEYNSSVYVSPPTNTTNPTPTPTVTQYTLTVTAGEGGSVSTAGGTYDDGTSISITATPNNGYSFSGWSNGSNDNPLSVTLNSNTSVTANFEKINYSININLEGLGIVEQEIITNLNGFDTLRLTAIAQENWEFKFWSGDTNSNDTVIDLILNSNLNISAKFIDKSLFLDDDSGIYFSDWIEDYDVLDSPDYYIIHPENLPEHNITIVSSENGHPVRDGDRSLRINWYPGDCGQWPGGVGWKDCDNKRGRSEIGDRNQLSYDDGPIIGWSYSMYLPEAKYIIPPDGMQTVMYQIYHKTDNWLKPLLFLRAEQDGSISVTNHEEFNNNINSITTIIEPDEVFNRWHDIEVTIEFQDFDNALVSFKVNGEIVHQIQRDMANQGDGKLDYEFRVGFYNGYFDNPNEWNGWVEQLMYVDNIIKKDNTFFQD